MTESSTPTSNGNSKTVDDITKATETPNSDGNLLDYWGASIGASVTSLFSGGDEPSTDDQAIDEVVENGEAKDGGLVETVENASKAAQETLGRVGEELGSGWGTFNKFLDDMLQGKGGGGEGGDGGGVEEEGGVQGAFERRFPQLKDMEGAEVVDRYRCVLVQKYRCYLNDATPEKSFGLPGWLFVTVACAAMYLEDREGIFGEKGKGQGVVVRFEEVQKIQRGSKAMLRLIMKDKRNFVFSGFESEADFTGCLSLIEHMIESVNKPPSKPKDTSESDKVEPENVNGADNGAANDHDGEKSENGIAS